MLLSGNMESKRQRHPSVRLGDIGEVPAALSCGVLQRSRANLKPACGFPTQLSSGFTSSDSTETQRWENDSHSNSVKESMGGACWDEVSASKPSLGFADDVAAPRVKVTKRGRSIRCTGVMGSSWYSGVSPRTGNGNGSFYGYYDATEEMKCDVVHDANLGAAEWSYPETTNRSKGSQRDDRFDVGYCAPLEDKVVHGTAAINDVKGWLDSLGFGKYAQIFEMHEVDGEALPLLTFEDLKEMGVDAVGSRRKMFHAIQLLKDGVSA